MPGLFKQHRTLGIGGEENVERRAIHDLGVQFSRRPVANTNDIAGCAGEFRRESQLQVSRSYWLQQL